METGELIEEKKKRKLNNFINLPSERPAIYIHSAQLLLPLWLYLA